VFFNIFLVIFSSPHAHTPELKKKKKMMKEREEAWCCVWVEKMVKGEKRKREKKNLGEK
jgi:hypothetical protein